MLGETVVCLAPRSWNSLWRETQQLMSRIAVQNRVLYFEPGRNNEMPALSEFMRNLPNYLRCRPHSLHANLTIIPTPSSLPIGNRRLPRTVLQASLPLVTGLNARVLTLYVRRVLRELAVHDPILWLSRLEDAALVGRLGEKLACYFNYDEFADFAHNRHISDIIRRVDDRLTRSVDIVFATSRAQTERRKAINPHTYFIPNGVNFALFSRALIDDLPIPADMQQITRPIIGYVGRLGHQIDIGLLRQVAEAYPDAALVLVGPDELTGSADLDVLRKLPNVHFLGRKPPAELPAYLRQFDVALGPWPLHGHLLSAYPLKLHEYLAAGRAVVATPLPELQPFAGVLHLAPPGPEFVQAIGTALQGDAEDRVEARVAVARTNTWDHRVAAIYQILDRHLLHSARRASGTMAGART